MWDIVWDSFDSSAFARIEDFFIDQSHSFYILPFNNPNTLLVSPPFDGNDFIAWKRNMVVALSAKNKLGVITVRNPQPLEDFSYYLDWELCNDMLVTWMTNSMFRNISPLRKRSKKT